MDIPAGLWFLGVALAIAAVGIVVGMLVAPRLTRLAERHEEDGDDGAS